MLRKLLPILAWMQVAVVAAVGRADEPLVAPDPPAPVVTQAALRAAVERALPLLQKAAQGHRQERTCFACHQQGLPVMAMIAARSRGFAINEAELKQQLVHTAQFLETNREGYLQGKGQGGQVDMAGYALWTLAIGGWPADKTTGAVAEYLLLYQADRDHWTTGARRPPSEASAFTTTYLGLRGLSAYGTQEQAPRVQSRVAQVKSWLLQAQAKDTEDRVFRLWALQSAGAAEEAIEEAKRQLLGGQRPDGGWAQVEGMPSDAYATGTALVALREAGGLPTSGEAYQRGLAFLLSTQRSDGSWHVVSRSKPFQTYFETGFPHGKDQFISCAASGWAATALALACEGK